MGSERVTFSLAVRDSEKFSRAMKGAAGDVDKLGDAGERAGRGLDKAADGSKKLEKAASRTGDQVGSLGRKLVTTTKVTSAAGVAFGAIIVKNGLGFNATFQSAERSMSTLLGSAAKGRKFMDDLREVSNGTPLKFTSVLDQARLMLGMEMSADRTKRSLMALNQAILASGGGQDNFERASLALAQLSANGTASKEELNQLAEAGVPVNKILQRELGLTGKEVANIGKEAISSDKVIDAIIRGWNKKFAGSARAAAHDWNNQTAQIGKDWEQLQRVVTEPLFEDLNKNVLPVVGRVVKNATSTFAAASKSGGLGHGFDSMIGSIDATVGAGGRLLVIWGRMKQAGSDLQTIIVGGIVPGATALLGVLTVLPSPLNLITGTLGVLADHTTVVKVAVIGLTGAYVTYKAVVLAGAGANKILAASEALKSKGLVTLLRRTTLVTAATKIWKVVQMGMNFVLSASPIGLVVVGIAALTAGVILAYRHSATFRNVVRSVWQWLSNIWSKLGPLKLLFVAAFGGPVLAAILAVKSAIGPVSAAIDKIEAGLGKIKGILPGQHASIGPDDIMFGGGGIPSTSSSPMGPPVPGRATGGLIQPGETRTLVGENGPELLRLPVGSLVSPIPRPQTPGGGQPIVIEIPVHLDGREIRRSVKRWDGYAGARA